MIKRKHIETVEEIAPPQALIVDDKHQGLVIHLTKVLTTRGCSVKTTTHNDVLHGEKFDYIFQLSDYSSAVNFFHKNLSSGGKFLFVEADTEEITDKEKLPFKILRIGNSSLWTTKELADKILKTNFSTSLMQVVDARKGHLVKQAPVRNVIKRRPIPPSQVAFVSKKRTWKNKLVILTLIFTAAVLLTGGYFFWSLISLRNTLSEVKVHFTTSNWNEAGNNLEKAQKKVIRLKKAYDFFWTLFVPLRDTAFVRDTGVLLTVTNNLLTSGNDFITTYQTDTFEIMPQVLTK
ncbi:hypothetical protein HY338_03670, partial [Candidatus Gottesmanbacteria bacterium]|nr:hypothetical protein [Candidatus Gottesmanbacteria bacterium]